MNVARRRSQYTVRPFCRLQPLFQCHRRRHHFVRQQPNKCVRVAAAPPQPPLLQARESDHIVRCIFQRGFALAFEGENSAAAASPLGRGRSNSYHLGISQLHLSLAFSLIVTRFLDTSVGRVEKLDHTHLLMMLLPQLEKLQHYESHLTDSGSGS